MSRNSMLETSTISEIQEQEDPGSAFLEYLEAQIVKIAQPWWRLLGFNVCTGLPKKTLDTSLVVVVSNPVAVT